jgi:hypothetical protein
MIRNNILNFERNLREAGKYRLGLRESIIEKDIKRDVESLFLSKSIRFERLNFYSLNARNPVSATDLSYNYKNFTFFLYYNYKNLSTISNAIDSISKRNKSYFKVLNRDLKKLKDQIAETEIKLNSKYNKVKVNSYFQEKDQLEKYDLIDLKTDKSLLSNQRLEFKDDVLRLPTYINNEVKVQKAEIVWEESFFGDSLKPLRISKDASYLYREEKVFNWVVGKRVFSQTGQVVKERPVNLSFVLHFCGEQKLNQIFIEFASELDVYLKDGKISYWSLGSWEDYSDLNIINESNRMQLYFSDELTTKKIKISLSQKKYFEFAEPGELSKMEEEVQKLINSSGLNYSEIVKDKEPLKIYDLSLLDVIPKYTKYKNFGYYREANPLAVNKPLSFTTEVEYSVEDLNVFLEKSAHIVLFGEEDYQAVKKKRVDFQRTPRYNNIISIPNSAYINEELLVFKNKEAKCLFFPDIRKGEKPLANRIKVYEDDVALELGVDYQISIDGLSTNVDITQSFGTLESLYPAKIAGEFFVILENRPKAEKQYKVVYDLDKSFYTDESKMIKVNRGSIVFDSKLHASVGFIRSRFFLRAHSRFNDSSLIKRYKVLVEEIEETETSNIEYEDFMEVTKRSTNNVI